MKTSIHSFILIAALAAIPLSANAADCAACTKADVLAKEIKALNFSKSDDRLKGQTKVDAGTVQLHDFEKVPKSDATRTKLFKSLLGMAREGSIYDGESALADELATQMTHDTGLKIVFMAYLKSAAKTPRVEFCKTQQMEASVGQDMCMKGAGIKGQDAANAKQEDKMKKCTRAFSFETCLSGKS